MTKNDILEEMQLRRSASPETLFEAATSLRSAAGQALERILPAILPPFDDRRLNREAAALLNVIAAADDTLTGEYGLVNLALGRVEGQPTALPPEVRRLHHQADTIRATLFNEGYRDAPRPDAYVFYSLAPAGPDDTVTLKQLKDGWNSLADSVAAEFRWHTPSRHSLTDDRLPPRDDVKPSGRTVKGWPRTRFDPDAGRQAVLEISRAMSLGRLYLDKLIRQPRHDIAV